MVLGGKLSDHCEHQLNLLSNFVLPIHQLHHHKMIIIVIIVIIVIMMIVWEGLRVRAGKQIQLILCASSDSSFIMNTSDACQVII